MDTACPSGDTPVSTGEDGDVGWERYETAFPKNDVGAAST